MQHEWVFGSFRVGFVGPSRFPSKSDEPTWGKMMQKICGQAGRPWAMVFLDYRMPPGWSGVETLRHLRQVAPTLPVVLCSAYSDWILREFPNTGPLTELSELAVGASGAGSNQRGTGSPLERRKGALKSLLA